MKKLLFILLLSVPAISNAQTVYSIAGDGSTGFYGDGGAPLLAAFDYQYFIALDSTGNVYLSDQDNMRIRKMNIATGLINTVAGNGMAGFGGDGGLATAAELNFPNGVAVDRGGNLYIADSYNRSVRKVNTSGIISTIAGDTVHVTSGSGDGGPATAAHFVYLINVATDSRGNVYAVDLSDNRIRKINTSGIITTVAGNGTAGFSGDGTPATAAQLNEPTSVAVDTAGNLYITDALNYRIRKVNTLGIISTIAGTGTSGDTEDGNPATAAEISTGVSVCVDKHGNILFSDEYFVRKINTLGIISTVVANGTPGFSGDGGAATAASFSSIQGIAVDTAGRIYCSDLSNLRTRMTIPGSNTAPRFDSGHIRDITVCRNSATFSINPLLNVTDPDIWQLERWHLIMPPAHGAVSATDSMITSVGRPVVPAGYAYAPATGYSGADTFRISVTDGFAFDTVVFYVLVDTVPDPGTLSGPSSLCVGHSITLAASAGGGAWSASNAHATVAGGIVTGVSGGSTGISYTLTDARSCAASAVQLLTIDPLPTVGVISGGSAVCIGSDLTLSNTSSGGAWTSVIPAIATIGATGIATGVATGVDTIKYTVTNSCGSTSVSKTITVETYIIAGPVYGSNSVCPGDTVMLTDSLTGGTWNSGDLTISTISSSGVVTGISPGADSIIYTISNSCGTSSRLFPFTVLSYSECRTKLSTVTPVSNLEVYPNPNDGSFSCRLSTAASEDARVMVYNTTGDKISDIKTLTNTLAHVHIAMPGIYFLFVTAAGEQYSRKIVVIQ